MAGTVTVTHYPVGVIRRIVVDWVADAADGSVPATALPQIEGRLLALATNPGSTAPTANYDITLPSAEGDDRLCGAGANRHTSNSEIAVVAFASSSVHPPVDGDETLTFTLANNSVNSALGRAIIYYTPVV